MTGDDRIAIERAIVACSLDSEQALAIACSTLPERPFRSRDAPELERAFYWAAGEAEAGRFDGIRNRDRLLDAMRAQDWPPGWSAAEREGWLEYTIGWTPLCYEPTAFRELCELLGETNAASAAQLDAATRLQSSAVARRVVADYDTGRPPERQKAAPRPESGGIGIV
jgi:hypothetical protein